MAAKRTAAPGVELVPVDALELHPANPRQGDIGAIVESIQHNGWWGVVVAQASTRRVLVGNHRLQAARMVGMEAVPVHWLDVPDDVALRVLLADNRSNDRAAYDDAALADLLQSILADAGTLDGTLFDADDLDQLLADLAPLPAVEASDDTPPVPAEAKTRPGDVFDLGPHRLVCGDSTDPEVIANALAGEVPDLIYADPPYGVNERTDRGTAGRGHITRSIDFPSVIGDESTATAERSYAALAPLGATMIYWGANYYAHALPASPSWIVWDKRDGVASDDNADCEMAWTNRGGPARVYSHLWKGAIKASEHGASRVHPTQKPAALAAWCIGTYPRSAVALVLDPFAGSGSALIGADSIGRRCIAIELDPAYCDVIRQRYADHANRPDLAP